MDRATFEASATADGYDLREAEIMPHQHRPPHTHPFDVRLFILDGAFTLVRGAERERLQPGSMCDVPAGTAHEEHTEAEGVRYVAARRAH
jgi:quercetin dioxygenase-like cupin family protein